MKLTQKEEAWLKRFEKTMAAAPKSLHSKISSYTIGDDNITLYDKKAFNDYYNANPLSQLNTTDHCQLVSNINAELMEIKFPFDVESTAG